MRIRDLIPDRDALISPDFYRRKNLLVQVLEDDERPRDRFDNDRGAATSGSGRTAAGLTEQARSERDSIPANGIPGVRIPA